MTGEGARTTAVPASTGPSQDLRGREGRSVFLRNVPGVVALALVLVVASLIFPEHADTPYFLASAALSLTSLATSFALPWERLPRALAILPALLVIAGVGALAAVGLRVSTLALIPLIDLARHHGRRGAVIGVIASITASQAEVLFSPAGLNREALMRLVVVTVVFITVAAFVSTLEQRAQARRRLLARQGRALTAAYDSLDVDRALLQGVVANISVGVVVIDGAGRVVHVNDAVSRYSPVLLTPDLDVTTLLGENGDEPATADVGVNLRHYLGRAVVDDPVHDETQWWTLPDGTQVALRANVVRVVTSRSRGTFRVLVLEDLTTEVSAVREREDFMGSVSHELRTPLTSVLGYLEMVIDDVGTPDPSRARLMIAERNVRRLDALVEDLLADAAARHAFSAPMIEDVPIGRVVRDSVQSLTPRAQRAGVEVETAVEEGLVVRGDVMGLGQVMDNLLSNAVKYSDPGDRVVVVAEREDGWAVVRVSDEGIGISPEDQERLFERFFRAEAVRSGERRGTGLGLHLVREIVRAHGGRLEVHSELGEGTQISVHLPLGASS